MMLKCAGHAHNKKVLGLGWQGQLGRMLLHILTDVERDVDPAVLVRELVQEDAAVQLGDDALVVAHDAADVLDDGVGLKGTTLPGVAGQSPYLQHCNTQRHMA